MGSDVGILWIILAFLVFGILCLFFIIGEFLTPKKSIITGKARSPEEVSKKGFTKGLILFVLSVFIFGILIGELRN